MRKLALAPWFKGRFKDTLDYIEFPGKKIRIEGGSSTDASALGLNVFAGVIDEGNFMGQVKQGDTAASAAGKTHDRAQMIYDALVRRVKSRYQRSGVKGMIFLVSSKRATDDFTERRIREHIKNKTTGGVFVRDYCLAGDTVIPLLDGTSPTIAELADRDALDSTDYCVYSVNSKGLIVPGKAFRPRLTKKNASVVKVTLDDGAALRLTADHRVMLRGGKFVEAGELKQGDSLMPLYRRLDNKGYEELSQPLWDGRWQRLPRYRELTVSHKELTLAAAPNNHSVVSVEEDGCCDVYDLSVEGHENFAVGAGVFVHNCTWDVKPEPFKDQKWYRCSVSSSEGRCRILEESEEAPEDALIFEFPHDYLSEFQRDPAGCFTGDTKISLLDGREVPIKDLVGEKEFWTYSFTPDGLFKPGRGHSARLTKKNASLVEVELDNGERIRCTPDHRFMLRDGSYLPALALSPGTSLMPLYRKTDKWGYEVLQVNTGSGRWMHTHRLVARVEHNDGERIPKGEVVHHRDFDKQNNTPKNLEPMLKEDHSLLHVEHASCNLRLLKNPALREEVFATLVGGPDNHKVVAIRLLTETADVYDITVDGMHNFALTGGVIVKNSTRDVAGIATDTYAPFISKREAIEEMFEPEWPHIFEHREWEMGRPLTIHWSKVMTKDARGDPVPYCCPHANRHVHIDLSKNMCATGFCMAHQAGMVEVARFDAGTRERTIEEAPVFHVDGILRILAGSAGEIDHSEVRGLIYKLNEGGFNIRSASMDHWMSVPNMQLLKKRGYRVEEISTVKKIDPFESVRSALYENRIRAPENDILRNELRTLELDPKRPAERPRVVVPPGYTKDVADSLAGSIYFLAVHAKGGTLLAPSLGLSATPDSSEPRWKNGDVIWGDEEGYDDLPDPDKSKGDPYLQSWII